MNKHPTTYHLSKVKALSCEYWFAHVCTVSYYHLIAGYILYLAKDIYFLDFLLMQRWCTNYRIAGNFRWCQFSRKSVQTLQKKFSRFLFSRMRALWPRPYQLTATPHMRNGTERRSEKASLCNNGLIFLCGGFRNYEGTRTAAAGEKPARWIQHCWSRLRQLRSVSRIRWYFV